jgi:hypothetical protein
VILTGWVKTGGNHQTLSETNGMAHSQPRPLEAKARFGRYASGTAGQSAILRRVAVLKGRAFRRAGKPSIFVIPNGLHSLLKDS